MIILTILEQNHLILMLSPFLDIRGYNSIGRMLTLHVKSLGSIPSFSKLVKLNWLSEILKLFRL